jgi:hypothetical protein
MDSGGFLNNSDADYPDVQTQPLVPVALARELYGEKAGDSLEILEAVAGFPSQGAQAVAVFDFLVPAVVVYGPVEEVFVQAGDFKRDWISGLSPGPLPI